MYCAFINSKKPGFIPASLFQTTNKI